MGGVFSLKLDGPTGSKELTGAAGNKDAEADHKLAATFHATLK